MPRIYEKDMGVIYDTIKVPNLHQYEPEHNPDGTEKHIVCDGARFHVVSYHGDGMRCSEKNCEINKRDRLGHNA